MKRLSKYLILGLYLLPLLSIYAFVPGVQAQETGGSTTSFGICAAYNNTPEGADYEDSGGEGEIDKFELFLDIGQIRFAVNAMHGSYRNRNTDTILRSNTTYLAYRFMAYDNRSRLDAYLLGGIALVASTLREGEKTVSSSDDYGYVLGTGVLYFVSDNLGLGCQLLRISASGELHGETIETGSDQLQMVFKYPF